MEEETFPDSGCERIALEPEPRKDLARRKIKGHPAHGRDMNISNRILAKKKKKKSRAILRKIIYHNQLGLFEVRKIGLTFKKSNMVILHICRKKKEHVA